MFSDYQFPPLTSVAAGRKCWPPPDQLTSSPLTSASNDSSHSIANLGPSCVMKPHHTKSYANVLASCGNQRPVTPVATGTPILAKNKPSVRGLELSSPTNYTPQTEQSLSTYPSLCFQDVRDARRASIEHLNLGPIAEEGLNILIESGGIIRGFLVHPQLLCHFSPYFRTVFGESVPKVFATEVKDSNFINELDFERNTEENAQEEGSAELDIKVNLPTARTQQVFKLPDTFGDVKHAVFATLVDWLYLGRGKFEPKDEKMADQTLIMLWVLAGRLGIPSCQKDCIAAIEGYRKRNRTIATSMLGWVYDNTRHYPRGKCGLKNLLIDQCALTLDEKWLAEGMEQRGFSEQFTMECLVDIITRMRVLLRDAGLGEASLTILPTSRRYWVDGDCSSV